MCVHVFLVYMLCTFYMYMFSCVPLVDVCSEFSHFSYLARLLFCVCRVRLHNPEPQEVVEMKRELAIWQRTANRLPVVSLEERAVREALQAKAHEVEQQLKENFSLL